MLKTIKELIDIMKGQKRQLWVSLLLSFIDSALFIIPIIIAFMIIGSIVEICPDTAMRLTTGMIIKYMIIMLFSILIRIVLRYFTLKFRSSSAYIVMNNERKILGSELFDVSMGYFNKKNLGDLVSMVTSDLNFIEMEGIGIVEKASIGIPSAVLGMLILIYLDLRIAFAVLILLVPAYFAYLYLSKTQDRLEINRPVMMGNVSEDVVEFINGLHVLKSFNIAKKNFSKTEKSFEDLRTLSEKLEIAHIPPAAVYQACFKAITAVIILLAAVLTLKGEIDYPAAFFLMLGSFSLFSSLEIMGIYSIFGKITQQAIDRINQIHNIPKMDSIKGTEIPKGYSISFKDITFAYEENTVLKNMNFNIPENSMTALVGMSGSGKTTVTNLIARFWDVSEGEILIGGINVKNIPYNELLAQISFVFQDVFLFNDTILNNIKVGNPSATKEEVIDASKRARCHDFITKKKDGYLSMVGEGGETLSGGEKQRIAIARAFVKNTPIVLLDEITANIDVENEYLIQQAMSELLRDRTVVVIAHKLTNIKHADQILVLEDGTISQKGDHEKLVKEQGLYKNLWELQNKTAKWTI